jgi:hypothetical protein
MADFSQINTQVTEQLTAETAATPSTNNTGADDLAGQLARAVAEIEALKSQRAREDAEHEAAVEAARLEVASKIAKTHGGKVGCSSQDLALDRAIAKVGGPAYWAKLSSAQQAAAIGVQGADTPLKVVKQYFGKDSDPKSANALAMSNPAEYKRLRGIAKTNGVF